ncbi:MAG: hypothetical protein L6R19_15395 [Alphaproteobacteria bacterium]|nr:hypothetical protein [Alphaproteobacteria bacterium]
MRLGRVLGWLFLAVAVAVLAADLLAWQQSGGWRLAALGEVWAQLHRDSLLLAEPAIDRHVWPGLWQSVIVPILLAPAAPVFALAGLVLLLLCRRRRRRGGLRD